MKTKKRVFTYFYVASYEDILRMKGSIEKGGQDKGEVDATNAKEALALIRERGSHHIQSPYHRIRLFKEVVGL